MGTDKDARISNCHRYVLPICTILQPALNRINSQCLERVSEVTEQNFNEQEILEQIGEMVHDKRDALSELERQVKQAEDTREDQKEVMSSVSGVHSH